MFVELIKFLVYSLLIVIISKYILVTSLRRLAENLNLKSRTIGNIAGVATSIPELLTVGISNFRGLLTSGFYNIISSNVINLIQFLVAIIINKNYKELKNKAIIINLILVVFTIIFPIFLLKLKIELDIKLIFILLILYFVFNFISKIIHEKYLNKEEIEIEEKEYRKEQLEKVNNNKTNIYFIYILGSGILLYIIGNQLGQVLEGLAKIFGIKEFILGILLGVITSIPELITFFESQRYYKNEQSKTILGVVEATNNLLTSNMLNLFIIQSIGIIIYLII